MNGKPLVPPAPADQKLGTPRVSSANRGAPVADMLARFEERDPGFEEAVGLSSAALRAGNMVREMRHARGWTQVQLAGKLGWDQVRISNIERGEGTRGPTFDVLSKIAAACDYQLDFQPRARAAPVAEKEPAFKSFREMWKGIIGDLPMAGGEAVYAFEPDFGKVYCRFVQNIQEGMPDQIRVFGTESDIVGTIIDPKAEEPPYFVLSGHGQRMTLMPVAVEEVETAASDIAVQLVRSKF